MTMTLITGERYVGRQPQGDGGLPSGNKGSPNAVGSFGGRIRSCFGGGGGGVGGRDCTPGVGVITRPAVP